MTEAAHSYDEMLSQCEQATKTLVKTQLFVGDALTCANSTDDPLQQLFNLLLQAAEAHSQATHDITEWKHADSKMKHTKYSKSKRSSRIQLEEGSSDMGGASTFSLQGGAKRSSAAGSGAAGGGQSEMLRQMKAQMSKMRKRQSVEVTGGGMDIGRVGGTLLGGADDDADTEELL